MHWKSIHKTTCSTQATIRQNLVESPKEKEWSKKITRWLNAWSMAIAYCSPIALDLANHEWGYHDTHGLVFVLESTGLEEDCKSFRAKDIVIRDIAGVARGEPELDYIMLNPPDLEWPRIRCFLFFDDEDPSKQGHGRIQGWCLPGIRELSEVDKDYSRAAARKAIPQLLNDINIVKDPQQSELRFKPMVMLPGIPVVSIPMTGPGEDPLGPLFEHILRSNAGGS